MPRQRVDDTIWSQRISVAKRYKEAWEHLFKVNILQKYYEGFQWKFAADAGYTPYTINKIYETIQIKIAEFIPTFPKYVVSSREGNEWDLEAAAASAQLKEDTLNQIVNDSKLNYTDELEQAYKESFFAFGLVEVGYSADWIINPNAPKPLLGKDVERDGNRDSFRIVQEPPEIPVNERVYIKHIPARTFIIGGNDHKYLNRCGWCGYYEYVDRDELLALPKLMNRDKIANIQGSDYEADREVSIDSLENRSGGRNSVKLWHIWDLKSINRLLIVDSPCVTVFQKEFKHLNLYDLRPDKRLRTGGFYPIPPAFHWLSPQDEFNETREMLRAHRRRFVRKFQVVEGRIDDEEIEKFETGPDGALIKVKAPESISPIQNADLGAALNESLATSADDLNRISGTSDDSRGVADRTTATQAQIVNQRSALRETKERDRIVNWACQIGRGILIIVNEKFTGKMLVELSAPEGTEDFLGVVQTRKAAMRYVTAEDLKDGYDFKIDVDLTSMSQTEQADQKKKLLEFLSTLTQFPMVAFSPYLVREIAVRIGYRNEKTIAEFQKMALLMEFARMQQLQQQAGAAMGPMQNGNAGQQINQQATPPQGQQIQNQLAKVLPMAQQAG